MSYLLRSVFVLAIVTCAAGCFPYSKRYQPAGDQEKQLFATARRDVYPDDVRGNVPAFDGQTLLWTGIVKAVRLTEDGLRFRMMIEHHYWDWIEDHSIQREIAFLSPRGEGMFACDYHPKADVKPEDVAHVEDMAIVYGIPKNITDDGVILMACPFFKTLRRELYATNIFSYGRNFSDLKGLRVPGVED
jgi:hypothetical protein